MDSIQVILFTDISKVPRKNCAGVHPNKKPVKAQFDPAFCQSCRHHIPLKGQYGWGYINELEADLITLLRLTPHYQTVINWVKSEVPEESISKVVLSTDRKNQAYEDAIRRLGSNEVVQASEDAGRMADTSIEKSPVKARSRRSSNGTRSRRPSIDEGVQASEVQSSIQTRRRRPSIEEGVQASEEVQASIGSNGARSRRSSIGSNGARRRRSSIGDIELSEEVKSSEGVQVYNLRSEGDTSIENGVGSSVQARIKAFENMSRLGSAIDDDYDMQSVCSEYTASSDYIVELSDNVMESSGDEVYDLTRRQIELR